jgi:repressor LexA
MHVLSEKQEKILRFIAEFARENAYPPSFREIGAACGGIKSSTVAYYIKVLTKKGILRQRSSKARDLKLASPSATCGLAGLGTRGYLGRIPAGKPNLVEEEIEDTLWLDERLCRSREAYLLRITGDSMIGAGVFHGDLVIVRAQRTADPGDIVVARTPDSEGTRQNTPPKRADLLSGRRKPQVCTDPPANRRRGESDGSYSPSCKLSQYSEGSPWMQGTPGAAVGCLARNAGIR